MPELPEVETTRQGLLPYLKGRRILDVTLYRSQLRWPIAREIQTHLPGQIVLDLRRRGKYLLMDSKQGTALWHLGMSGSLRITPADQALRRHDHVQLQLDSGQCVRFNDPRRFGCLLWQAPGQTHPLLQTLGPEPLQDGFDGDYLYRISRGRTQAVKTFLMDAHIVVGVGNIYANEALFAAQIAPHRAAGRISRARFERLANAIKDILQAAIAQGGTTLRDFYSPQGTPGYFAQVLQVYGQPGAPCPRCARPLKHQVIAQRSTIWCSHCQR